MKYLKKFENNNKYNLYDFTIGSYWRYDNLVIDGVMKIDNIKISESPPIDRDYDIIHIEFKTKDVTRLKLNESILKGIIDDSYKKNLILRPATDDEISFFNTFLSSDKYNL